MANESDGSLEIDVIMDITQAQKNLQTLEAELKKSEKELSKVVEKLNKLDKDIKLDPENPKLYTEKIKLLEKQLELAGQRLNTLAQAQEQVNEKFKAGEMSSKEYENFSNDVDKTIQSITEFKKALETTNTEYENCITKNKETAEKLKNTEKGLTDIKTVAEAAGINIDDFAKSTEKAVEGTENLKDSTEKAAEETENFKDLTEGATEKTSQFGDMLKAKLTGDILIAGIKKLADAVLEIGKNTISTGIEFQSAFSGVIKTVDGTDQQLEALKTGIREMALEIPASTSAISEVAEAAGQLGIQTGNILDFTEVMVGLGESTDVSSQQAASSLAQFANITKMSQSDFDRLGSVIVDLGNNFATTESSIIAMGQRLAGVGAQVGFSEAEIMAYATALSSLGIEVEAGGSAVSTAIAKMQLAVVRSGSDLEEYANIAGMTGQQFKKAFEEDAAQAFNIFIQGLGKAATEGKSMIAILDDMGVKEVRQRDAILRLASSGEILTSAIQAGNKAWEENTALQDEVSKRYETTESQLQIAKNALNDVAISVSEGLLPSINELSQSFVSFIQDNKDGFIAFGETVTGIFSFIIDNSNFVIGGLTSISGAALAVKAGFVSTSTILTGLSGPIGLVIAGISGLALAYNSYTKSQEEAQAAAEAFRNECLNASTILDELQEKSRAANDNLLFGTDIIAQYKQLTAEIKSSTISVEEKTAKQEQLAAIEQQLISLSDGLIEKTNLENGTVSELLPILEKQLSIKKEMAQWEEEIFKRSHSIETVKAETEAAKAKYETLQQEFDLMNKQYIQIIELKAEYDKITSTYGENSAEAIIALNNLNDALGLAGVQTSIWADGVKDAETGVNKFIEEHNKLRNSLVDSAQEYANSQSNLVRYEELTAESTRQTEEYSRTLNTLKTTLQEGIITQEEYNEEVKRLEALSNRNKIAISNTTSTLQENNNVVASASNYYKDLADRLEWAKAQTDILKTAGEQLTNGFLLEEEQLNDLIACFPDLGKYIEETGDITLDSGKKVLETHDKLGTSSEILRQATIKTAQATIESTRQAAEAAIQNYEAERAALVQLAKAKYAASGVFSAAMAGFDAGNQAIIDGLNNKLAETEKYFKQLEAIGPITAKSLSAGAESVGSSAKKAVDETKKAVDEAKKQADEYKAKVKETQSELINLGNSLTDALKTMAQESYDNHINLLDESVETYRNTENEKIQIISDNTDERFRLISNAEFDQLELKRDYANMEIELLSDTHLEQIQLIEDKTQTALDALEREKEGSEASTSVAIEGINAQIEEQMNLIMLKDKALYDQLMALKEEKDQIKEVVQARKEAREQEEIENRLAEYNKRLEAAETAEKKKDIEKQLESYKQSLKDKEDEKAEKSRLNEITAEEKRLMTEASTSIKEYEENIKSLQKTQDELVNTTIEEYLISNTDLAKTELDKIIQQAPRLAATLLKGGEYSLQQAQELLDKYAPGWRDAGKSFIDYFNEGMQDSSEELIEGMTQSGIDAMDGLMQSIRDKKPEVMDELYILINEMLAALRSSKGLDEHSPSKKTYKIGAYAGEGLVSGTVDEVNRLMPKIYSAAASIPQAMAVAGSHISNSSHQVFNNSSTYSTYNYNTSIPLYVDTINGGNEQDIIAVSENLAFLQRRAFMAKGGF